MELIYLIFVDHIVSVHNIVVVHMCIIIHECIIIRVYVAIYIYFRILYNTFQLQFDFECLWYVPNGERDWCGSVQPTLITITSWQIGQCAHHMRHLPPVRRMGMLKLPLTSW